MKKHLFLPQRLRNALQERFLRYIQMDTQSSDNPEDDHITLPKQMAFGAMLAEELTNIGCKDVVQHQCGYVFATIPASDSTPDSVPTIGLLAHMDTYHGTAGANVTPQIHFNYNGEDLKLPGTLNQMIKVAENQGLMECLGHTIITSDGTTLLGADDKAGIAEIITIAEYLLLHPEVKHGRIRICFTTNEEVGRGTEHFDNPELGLVKYFGAQYAYTMDGGELGEIEDETFSADSAVVTITGHDCHPGKAKTGGMINAVRAAASLVGLVDVQFIPETTDERQPYLHPYDMCGNTTEMVISFLVRAFTEDELLAREDSLREAIKIVEAEFPGIQITLNIKESYRNMKMVLDQHPQVMDNALKALKRQGIEPKCIPIRGGTDGSRLSYMGIPTPNLFAGGQNMHAVDEWVSLDWMVAATETAIQLAMVWYDESISV